VPKGNAPELVIPPREEIEHLYSKTENEMLDAFRTLVARIEPSKRALRGREVLRKLWPDELEYISKTHWITTKEAGEAKLLEPNYAQRRFYKDVIVRCREEGLPIRSVILKARQLGFSTFIQAWQYEQCDREPYRRAMTVSYDDNSTEELFQKSKFIRSHQWFPQEAERERSSTLEFAHNGSTFYTKTAGSLHAGRSFTIHNLHCSEVPMWPNAEETLVGLLDAVPIKPQTSVFFESTAKGRRGAFYESWKKASEGRSRYVPFFAPWFWDPEYQLQFPSEDHKRAFGRGLQRAEAVLMQDHNVTLEQLNWRRAKIADDPQGSEAKFRQEFPSYPEEAFLTSGSPVFNADAVMELERNSAPPLWVGHIHMTT